MCTFWRNCSRLLAVVLCHLLLAQAILAQPGQQALNIRVIEGGAARNVVQQIAARPITVQVENSQGRPVVGARVIFTSPQLGPSGEFSNDLRTLELSTDSSGRASADHYHPNATTGSYFIDVTAEFQDQKAMIRVPQENVVQGKSHGKLIAILAIGGAAVAAIVASSLKKNSGGTTTPTTPPTITLGGNTVGAPTP
jgi:hypothetical protein